MKKRDFNGVIMLLLVAMLLALLSPTAVPAEENTDARIKQIEDTVKALQNELNELKAERAKAPSAVDQKQLEELVDKTFEEKKVQFGAAPDWVKNIKLFGDFRYRHEVMEEEKDNKDDRHRNRIRTRLGLAAKVNEEWDFNLRLASGDSQGSTSTNQTLDGEFEIKNLWLDQAYAVWRPGWQSGLSVDMGKMKNPFYRVGKNQLISDGDLNPEGIAAQYKRAINDSDELFLNTGGFVVEEDDSTSGAADASLWGIQTGLKRALNEKCHALAGLSYWDYGNASVASGLHPTSKGGSSTFDDNFRLVELFAEVGTVVNSLPVSIYGNHVTNTGTNSSHDKAWLIGTKLNKAKKPRSWELSYEYRELDADAVPAAFNDSDFIDGGTDGNGHKFAGKYQLSENLQTGLTFFVADRTRSGGDDLNFRRLMLDLIFKF
jgi:hypothetical protein